MRAAVAAGTGVMLVLLAACGLGDSGFEELRRGRREVGDRGDDDDHHDHDDDNDRAVVPSTVPGATTTTTATTPIQTQPIEFYWIVESTGQVLVQIIPAV
jgi:hypothetical protein